MKLLILISVVVILGFLSYFTKSDEHDEHDEPKQKLTPHDYMELCIEQAKSSTCCRSKCGSVIVSKDGDIIGTGFNSKPCGVVGECQKDNLDKSFKSDKTCCVHSEQRAIMDCLKHNPTKIQGSSLFFVRLDINNNMLFAGKPYCTICSKMALDSGIAEFALWHHDGIKIYDTETYNKLSFEYKED